jgi:hypothetical protein
MEQLEQFVEAFAQGRLDEAKEMLKDILTQEANKLLEATESDDMEDEEVDDEEEVEEKGEDESKEKED